MKLFLLVFILVWGSPVFARDFVVIQNKSCEFSQGLIVGVDEDIKLLTKSGKIQNISESDISTILTYGINETPFDKMFNPRSDLWSYFRKIELREGSEAVVGVPFQYIEDLIFLLTDKGKVVVLGASEVKNISSITSSRSFKSLQAKTISVDYEEKASECDLKKGSGKGVKTPIRVLGDNLKISEYLSNYRKGHRAFRDLEERTDFYFKPYLYPKRNRMGIVQLDGQKQLSLPFFYQWSTGEDFHFQSVNQFGGTISRYMPTFEKNTSFTSEFKSHFFHGYFEGNLAGLSAGTIPGDFGTERPKNSGVINNFNYMAFMGGDWKNFSFSYGGGYFSPYFNLKDYETREVAANSISSAIRLGYQFKNIKINVLGYFLDDKSSSSFDVDDQINTGSINGISDNDINSYEYEATYYRTSVLWDVIDELSLQADLLVGAGEYSDSGSQGLKIEHNMQAYLIQIRRRFGHYVTLTLLMKSESQKLESTLGGTSRDFDSDNTVYGGRFELLF